MQTLLQGALVDPGQAAPPQALLALVLQQSPCLPGGWAPLLAGPPPGGRVSLLLPGGLDRVHLEHLVLAELLQQLAACTSGGDTILINTILIIFGVLQYM